MSRPCHREISSFPRPDDCAFGPAIFRALGNWVGALSGPAYMNHMFGDFLRRLTEPSPAPLADTDARLALTALLVRIARSDHHYTVDEVAQIEAVIAQRFGLDPNATRALREDGEQLETEAPDTVRFTRAIKDAVPYEDRVGVVEALWSVALADGERDDAEDAILRLSAKLLGVNDGDSARARQRAQRG